MRHRHLFLPFALLALFFVSCDGAEGQYSEEPFVTHPHWTSDSIDNFWERTLDTLEHQR